MKPFISVIIPAYNSGEYLARCLDSICAQTFADFEAFVVNASSTDRTAEIAEEYCLKDRRFRLLTCPNQSAGGVRDFAFDAVSAQYIAFSDSDDSMRPDMLEVLYKRAEETAADIVVCDLDMLYPDRVVRNYSGMGDYGVTIDEDGVTDYYFRFGAAPKPNNYVWARLYRHDFLREKGIRFKHMNCSEDHTFNLMALCESPKISHVGRSLYNYIQREDSQVRKNARDVNSGTVFLSAYDVTREYLEEKNKVFTEPILAIYTYTRIRSILFYAKQAGLDENKTHEALEVFVAGEKVGYYLKRCVDGGYFDNYCDMHRLDNEFRREMRGIISACAEGKAAEATGEVPCS